jgi:hypothetical protein
MMATQTYANHPHTPTLTLLAGGCLLIAIAGFVMRWLGVGGGAPPVMSLGGLTAAVGVLISISRVYTTKLQDRIIRLEMRVRCAPLLTAEQQRALLALDLRRIAALRFASDEEIPTLLDRVVRESLTADQIKRAIRNWVPDLDRT